MRRMFGPTGAQHYQWTYPVPWERPNWSIKRPTKIEVSSWNAVALQSPFSCPSSLREKLVLKIIREAWTVTEKNESKYWLEIKLRHEPGNFRPLCRDWGGKINDVFHHNSMLLSCTQWLPTIFLVRRLSHSLWPRYYRMPQVGRPLGRFPLTSMFKPILPCTQSARIRWSYADLLDDTSVKSVFVFDMIIACYVIRMGFIGSVVRNSAFFRFCRWGRVAQGDYSEFGQVPRDQFYRKMPGSGYPARQYTKGRESGESAYPWWLLNDPIYPIHLERN